MSDRLRAEFEGTGYPLATTQSPASGRRHLIEVYPHVAALELLGAASRVPYKVSKIRKYWPSLDRNARLRALLAEWARLRMALELDIGDCCLHVHDPDAVRTVSGLKPHEDCLDALVCAWVGVRFASGLARPCGDATAAIWVPTTVHR